MYITGAASFDFLTVSYTNGGSDRWTRLKQGTTIAAEARGIAIDPLDHAYVTGVLLDMDGDQAMTVEYDNTGNELRTNTYDDRSPDSNYAITAFPAGGAIVAGTTFSTFDGVDEFIVRRLSAEAPTITNVAPAAGPVGGGQSVTITGSSLINATVVIGGNTASMTGTTETTATFTTPAHAAGSVDITVTTLGGNATAHNAYSYVAAPTITSVDPSHGTTLGGQSVTITGTNLSNASVTFGGVTITNFTAASGTALTFATPAHAAGTINVNVTTAGGSVTAPNAYTYADGTTTTSLTVAAGTFLTGDTVTLNATVSPGSATGTITLKEGASVIASASLSGGAASIPVSVLTAGTHSITATYSGDGVYDASASSAVGVTIYRHVRSDLNRDGRSDIVIRNVNTAAIAAWLMNDTTMIAGKVVATPQADWQPVATGDLDGDGRSDLIMKNNATGAIAYWKMNGTTLVSGTTIAMPNVAWRVVGARDFNHDGYDDLVLQNSSTGAVALWQMNAATITAGINLGVNVRAIALGNLGGDAIVFQNTSTSVVSRWIVSGNSVTSDQVIASPASAWIAVTAADFDGDGYDDLGLQNGSTRAVAVWLLNATGTTITQASVIATPAPDWKVVGSADYDGNGRGDLLLVNTLTNAIAQWQMNGMTIAKGSNINTSSTWYPLGN